MEEYELVVEDAGRSFFSRIIAAGFFTVLSYLLFLIGCAAFSSSNGFVIAIVTACEYAFPIGICLSGGILFSLKKSILIDLDTHKLISRYSIGSFSRDILTEVPSLEYVAVYFNPKEQYEVNLWYKPNKHYNMYVFDEKKPAFDFAKMVCQKLKIEMLDATEKGNFTWRDHE